MHATQYAKIKYMGRGVCYLGPRLLTQFNFNPNMDK